MPLNEWQSIATTGISVSTHISQKERLSWKIFSVCRPHFHILQARLLRSLFRTVFSMIFVQQTTLENRDATQPQSKGRRALSAPLSSEAGLRVLLPGRKPQVGAPASPTSPPAKHTPAPPAAKVGVAEDEHFLWGRQGRQQRDSLFLWSVSKG